MIKSSWSLRGEKALHQVLCTCLETQYVTKLPSNAT